MGAGALLAVTGGVLQACQSAPAAAPTTSTTGSGGANTGMTPAAGQAAPAAAGGQSLVVALTSWATETSVPWQSTQGEKPVWEVMFDELVWRDPKTYQFAPGLATAWEHSDDYRAWTFKLRQGVMFHGKWGEMTSEDIKYGLEQNLKPTATGGDGPYFKANLDAVEVPDKYTVVMRFKTPLWDVLTHVAQMTGYQWVTSKAYVESVGEEKANLEPIGTGPYRHVEGLQGQYHTFEAVPNHWRVKPGFQKLTIRRILEPTTQISALRAGELDIIQVGGDSIDQAKSAGLRLHESPGAINHWIILPGQTIPGKDDFKPELTPWADDPNDPKSIERAKQIRLALNLAVNRQAIYDAIYRGYGKAQPFSYWYFPINKGFSTEWALEPYDRDRAKKLLDEMGVSKGMSINLNTISAQVDAPDIVEAVAQDWEKLGITVNRAKEDPATFNIKRRQRKTGQTGELYAPPSPLDEPSLLWNRCIHSKGALFLLCDGQYDQQLDEITAELNTDKRTTLTTALGTRLVNEYRGVRIGTKSGLWAISKKVGNWPTLTSVQYETNLDMITPA
jgi:peptide/nickel transport system substrate-binding protein